MLCIAEEFILICKKSLLSVALIAALTTVGCSSSPDDKNLVSENTSLAEKYQEAKAFLEGGNYFAASEILSKLDSIYPFGPYSHQIQLDLIYAYYKMDKTAQALAGIDRFIRLNPDHQSLDYAYYLRGLVNLQSTRNAFQEIAGIERFDRDISKYRDAFSDFNTIVTKYPASKYAADSKQRMVFIKEFIAQTELSVADFYMRRGAFGAAANRAKYVLENYRDSKQIEKALEVMVQAYDKLKMPDLKSNAQAVLKLNYPNNSYAND